MKLRNIMAATAIGLLSFPAMAQTDNYLHLRTTDGWQILNLANVEKLTFNGGSMKALDANDNVVASFPQGSLREMNVNQTAGVESVANDVDATFRLCGDVVEMLADGDFKVFDINGRLLVEIDNANQGDKISLAALANGVYILSSANFNLKYSKQ